MKNVELYVSRSKLNHDFHCLNSLKVEVWNKEKNLFWEYADYLFLKMHKFNLHSFFYYIIFGHALHKWSPVDISNFIEDDLLV